MTTCFPAIREGTLTSDGGNPLWMVTSGILSPTWMAFVPTATAASTAKAVLKRTALGRLELLQYRTEFQLVGVARFNLVVLLLCAVVRLLLLVLPFELGFRFLLGNQLRTIFAEQVFLCPLVGCHFEIAY